MDLTVLTSILQDHIILSIHGKDASPSNEQEALTTGEGTPRQVSDIDRVVTASKQLKSGSGGKLMKASVKLLKSVQFPLSSSPGTENIVVSVATSPVLELAVTVS